MTVTPYAGVWIEICVYLLAYSILAVTPYAGVWIEIGQRNRILYILPVTPYAGVWIEIQERCLHKARKTSLPTRECGLKY